ncbi:MAG: GTP 3',8-cyclase MoaA [Deltaproteobacteria bacterium]|nr:GTP 3',8-cyclase MoaA [Deltaproteobacteria bacterium]
MPEAFGADKLPKLVDKQGRRYTYLRFSVTDRCDLRCVYCMPAGGEDDHASRPELLSFEEAARLVTVFAASGIRRVRFTGGEPLVRRDFLRLIELVRRGTAIEELVMTTNATRLAELARPLAKAGLGGVNISLDTLDAERFTRLTRGGDLRRVLAGVHAAIDAGLEVKLNTVLVRGETDHEAGRLVDFAWSVGATPRFIELMPLGAGSDLPASAKVSAEEVASMLGDRIARVPPAKRHADSVPRGPARYLAAADGSPNRVGFITPLSHEFCDTCNRVRVTARGDLRACLASRRAISLRDLMRAGASDRELAWALNWTLSTKADGHFFHDASVDEHQHVGMSLIGG